MTTSIDTFPDYRKIDTPWEPQPIVPRYRNGGVPKTLKEAQPENYDVDGLREQANNPTLTHLVREVRVLTDVDGKESFGRSVDEISNDLLRVDDQFAQLEDLTDIKVAPTKWHVFEDENGYTRTLARVEIIEGEDRQWPSLINSEDPEIDFLTPEEYMLLMGLEDGTRIYTTQARGRLLLDIEPLRQYKLGMPRTNLMSLLAFYLIDIEPRLTAFPVNE